MLIAIHYFVCGGKGEESVWCGDAEAAQGMWSVGPSPWINDCISQGCYQNFMKFHDLDTILEVWHFTSGMLFFSFFGFVLCVWSSMFYYDLSNYHWLRFEELIRKAFCIAKQIYSKIILKGLSEFLARGHFESLLCYNTFSSLGAWTFLYMNL